jgi:ribosome-associated protein
MDRAALETWIRTSADEQHSRASGPGGQNVNKVNSAVSLHMDISQMAGLSDSERALLRLKLAGRINNADQLVLRAQDSRSQNQNRELVIERALILIERALHRDKPRRATKPSRASQERRVASKKISASHKKNRGRPRDE